METFRELLDAGCGERHLDAVTGGCPGCGSGDLVIVEDAEHELKLFCRECNRCWAWRAIDCTTSTPLAARVVGKRAAALVDSATTYRDGEGGTRTRPCRDHP